MFALSFMVALFITPFVFYLLQKFNIRKRNIRDAETAPIFHGLHKGKSDTPTMGGGIVWISVLGLAFAFFALSKLWGGFAGYLNFVSRAETYLPLVAFALAAIVGLVDDLFGILGRGLRGGGLNMTQKISLYTAVALSV